ncbi:hypothetical protein KFK09_000481 [Dendrobium nobile]|uniref:RNase H type-1 domain-containing protein n=1 Tax=Dendrobium nobile TaxID=94219 RepID=A0A8T3CEV2_DENNO|nr:hypothetical protein KFK09_000481 [Dendrobium nobile]
MNATSIILMVIYKVRQLYLANLINNNSFTGCHQTAQLFGINFRYTAHFRKDTIVKWTKAPQGFYKLNVDESFKTIKAGCAGLIQDHNGHVIVAFAGPSVANNAIMTELDALNYGVHLCLSLGIINLWIEVDAMLVIHYIFSKVNDNPKYFYTMREIKQCLSTINFSITHIYREANYAAYFLANFGCNLLEFREFMGPALPTSIDGITRLDCLGLPYVRSS